MEIMFSHLGVGMAYDALDGLDIHAQRLHLRHIGVAASGFAVCRLILKLLLFYSCLDFTQNLGETHIFLAQNPYGN